MSEHINTNNTSNDDTDAKSGLNPTSVAIFAIIAILSVLVGVLGALYYSNGSSRDRPSETVDSSFSPLTGDLENNKDIILWNATARDSIAEVLRVLDLSELIDTETVSETEEKAVFFRTCRDIQGRDKDLYNFAEVPNPSLQVLYVEWADSVRDVAEACANVTEDTIDAEVINSKIARSWSLFDSFFMGVQPFIEKPPSQEQEVQ